MVPCSAAVRNDPGKHGAYIWQNIERLNRDLLKGGLLL